MKKKTIRDEIATIKGGQFVRLAYTTDISSKLKADAKRAGYRVLKVTETTGRTGIEYGHIAKVIAKKENAETSSRSYTNPYTWIIPNRIKVHTEKGTEYLVLGTIPNNSNTKVKYIIINGANIKCVDILSDADKELFTGSAFSAKETPDILTIKMENITMFNGVA